MRPGWSKVTLEEVATIVGRGVTPKYAENGDFQVINQKCVRGGRVSFEQARRHDSEQRTVREDKVVQLNDILVNSTGAGTLGRTAPVRSLNGPTTVDSHLTIVRPSDAVDPRWLAYAISFAEPEIVAMAEGSTGQTELSRHRLAQLELSLPTLSEQKLIAATLGALDNKIESNQRQMSILDSIFHAKWGKLYRSLSHSRLCKLSSKVRTQYGLTAKATNDPNDFKFLRVTDINKVNWVTWSSVPTVSLTCAEREKYQLHRGDLLVTRMADPGKSAIYEDDRVAAVFASYLVRLEPRSYEEGLFIYGFLKSSMYMRYAAAAMSGSVQRNMNARIIVDTEFRWPTEATLVEFALEVGPLRDAIVARVAESSKLNEIRRVFLSQLVSGSISVAIERL